MLIDIPMLKVIDLKHEKPILPKNKIILLSWALHTFYFIIANIQRISHLLHSCVINKVNT